MTYAYIAFMAVLAIVMFVAGYASGYSDASEMWRHRIERVRGLYVGVGGMREW